MLDKAEAERREIYRDLALWVRAELDDGKSQEEIIAGLEEEQWPRDFATELVRAVTSASTEQAVERDPSGDFAISAVASAIGGGATWATFAAADPGGTFFMLWGPAVYGGWKFLQGVLRYVSYPTGRGLLLGVLALGVLAASGLALGVAVSQTESDGNGTTSQSPRIDIPNIPDIPFGQTNIFDLEVGDCFSDVLGGEAASVTLVPCDSSGATERVTMQFDVARVGSYPNISYFDEQAVSRCPLADDGYFHPTAESWAEGDRQIICLRSLR